MDNTYLLTAVCIALKLVIGFTVAKIGYLVFCKYRAEKQNPDGGK